MGGACGRGAVVGGAGKQAAVGVKGGMGQQEGVPCLAVPADAFAGPTPFADHAAMSYSAFLGP